MLVLRLLLYQYNETFHNRIIQQCKCYDRYKGANISGDYMACVRNKYGEIVHCILPIMIGSWLDVQIRGLETVEKEHQFWGCLYMDQQMKTCSSFSTYDSLSIHLKFKKATGKLSVFWYFYYKGSGVAVEYVDGVLYWKYENETYRNWDVINMINETNIFGTEITSEDLKSLFEALLQSSDYNMHDLKNRKIITAVKILEKKLKQIDVSKVTKKLCALVRKDFVSGMFVNTLTKKNSVESQNLTNNKQFIVPLQQGRLGVGNALVSKIVRATNQGSRNLTMLSFPRDGLSFLCTHHNKELKNSGDSFVMTIGTIISLEIDQFLVHKWLMSFVGQYRVILNYQFTNCYIDWSFAFLFSIKKAFPMINCTLYNNFVFINTLGASLLKFYAPYNIFVSPFEATHFNLVFDYNDSISLIPKQIPFLLHTPPSKITVAINNSQNSVFMIKDESMISMLEHMRGLKCYMKLNPIQYESDLVPESFVDFDNFFNIYTKLFNNISKERSKYESVEADIPIDLELLKYIVSPLDTKYDGSVSKKKKIEKYIESVKRKTKNMHANPWLIMPYAAFGDFQGCTIEDGVVADKTFLEQLGEVVHLTNSLLIFTATHKINERFLIVRISHIEDDDHILSFTYNQPLKYTTSSQYLIQERKIGLLYMYIISYNKTLQTNKKAEYTISENTVRISIKSEVRTRVGVGSKISNCWGQKNIISAAIDLKRTTWGITRRNQVVYPQLIYSTVSLLSRVPTGQLHYMLQSDDLAFGPNGEIMAPIPTLISSLSTHTQVKLFSTKIDTLMRLNGFLSMNLINTLSRLRRPYTNSVNDLLTLYNLYID